MSRWGVVALMLFLPAAFAVAGLLKYFVENHPYPIREWRLWHGPLEDCPNCQASIPLGWVEFLHPGKAPSDPEFMFDDAYIVRGFGTTFGGGAQCSMCGTNRPDTGGAKRPNLFEYRRNKGFLAPEGPPRDNRL